VDVNTYGLVVQASPPPDEVGSVEREMTLLEALREQGAGPDPTAFLLAAYACKQAANATAALALLDAHELTEGLPAPEEAFYAAVISACGRACRWELQWIAWERAQARGVTMGVASTTIVLQGCARTGSWRRASGVVDDLLKETSASAQTADVGLYSAAISCCEFGRQWQYALDLLETMERRGVRPDVGCYTAAMQALASSVELDRCMALLNGMGSARSDVLRQSFPVHRIVLEACRQAGDDGLASEVEALVRARGLRSLPAEAGLAPKRRGKRRQCTTFSNHDRGQSDARLRKAVRELSARLQSAAAYVPRYDSLPTAFLRASTRQQRDASLQSHAEKKALVDLLERERPNLELSINFHACIDCHDFLKGASRLLGRDITLHEPKLVHRIVDGECSCGDAWRWEARARVS
jgi:hypothetical protein